MLPAQSEPTLSAMYQRNLSRLFRSLPPFFGLFRPFSPRAPASFRFLAFWLLVFPRSPDPLVPLRNVPQVQS